MRSTDLSWMLDWWLMVHLLVRCYALPLFFRSPPTVSSWQLGSSFKKKLKEHPDESDLIDRIYIDPMMSNEFNDFSLFISITLIFKIKRQDLPLDLSLQ